MDHMKAILWGLLQELQQIWVLTAFQRQEIMTKRNSASKIVSQSHSLGVLSECNGQANNAPPWFAILRREWLLSETMQLLISKFLSSVHPSRAALLNINVSEHLQGCQPDSMKDGAEWKKASGKFWVLHQHIILDPVLEWCASPAQINGPKVSAISDK